jgi:type I restriction enzyme S subunit
MNSGWLSDKLGNLCEIELGRTPSRAQIAYWDDRRETGNVWLSIADLLNAEANVVIDSKEYVSAKGAELCRLVSKGTLLVSFKLTLGRLAFAGRDLFTNEAIAALTPLSGSALSKEFLFYFLRYFDWVKAAEHDVKLKGMTFNKAKLKEIEVHFPAAHLEQQRIVGILDEAFRGIATAKTNAEQNLRNASALFESHLHFVFAQRGPGSVERRLGEICAITSTLVDPREDEYCDLIHVGAENIESKTGAFVDLKTARQEGLISGKFLFDESMVLYSKIRPYLMKVGRPAFSGLCSADMYPLAPNANVVSRDYLFHLLLSKHFTDYVIQGSARAGMPKVNRQHLFEFRVWLPNVREQERIASDLDDLHESAQRLANVYERKLGELDALKRSLLHQAFTGQL